MPSLILVIYSYLLRIALYMSRLRYRGLHHSHFDATKLIG